MSINYTARTWVTGEVVTAAEMNAEIKTPFTGLQSALTPWTPTVTNMTLGNGTIVARYQQIGKLIFVRFTMNAGTTSTYTASPITFSLPFTSIAGAEQQLGGKLFTGGANLAVTAAVNSGASVITPLANNVSTSPAMTFMSSATQNTGTVGNLEIFGFYEAA